jgi:glycine dehydrogenase
MSLDSHTPTRSSLATLFATDDFVGRHIGPTAAEQAHMLEVLGVGSLDELLDQTVPAAIRLQGPLPLPDSRTVPDVYSPS